MVNDYIAGSDLVTATVHQFALMADWEQVSLRYEHAQTRATIENQKTDFGVRENFWYNQAGFDDQEDQFSADFNHRLGSSAFNLGFDYRVYQSRSDLWATAGNFNDESTWQRVSQEVLGIYAENQWMASERWAFTTGFRVDQVSGLDLQFSPRLAVNYTPSNEWFMRWSLASSYRLPSTIEANIIDGWFTADPDLDAETIRAVEWGVQHQTSGFRFSSNLYYQRVDDLISFQPLPADQMEANWNRWLTRLLSGQIDDSVSPGPIFAYTNDDNPLHTVGLELEAHWQAHPRVELWSNVTLQHARYEHSQRLSSPGFVGAIPVNGMLVNQQLFTFDENLGDDINTPPPTISVLASVGRRTVFLSIPLCDW